MKYPFNTSKKELKDYLFELKEVCIIEHEDNWFKEKSHTKLYPNVNEAKLKVGKPHYWIINAVEKYEDEDCEDKELALVELGQLVFKSNYYSQKLTSETENEDAKKDLVSSLRFLNIADSVIAGQIISMDTPKYARFEMSEDDALALISSWK
tara:strand:+ start:214 stop:669 length:456 start_codon:yes stop_codon:yes gene_type:complete